MSSIFDSLEQDQVGWPESKRYNVRAPGSVKLVMYQMNPTLVVHIARGYAPPRVNRMPVIFVGREQTHLSVQAVEPLVVDGVPMRDFSVQEEFKNIAIVGNLRRSTTLCLLPPGKYLVANGSQTNIELIVPDGPPPEFGWYADELLQQQETQHHTGALQCP